MKKTLFILLGAVLISAISLSQDAYKLDPSESKMMVKGTSNLHDWEMDVENPEGYVKFRKNQKQLDAVEDLKISILAENIQSGNRIMDGKTRDALDSKKYELITFRSTSDGTITANGSGFKGSIRGNLVIAGKTKNITLQFNGNLVNGKEIKIKGSHSIKMSDFDIDAPTAMLGSLKTGDEVTVDYDILLRTY